MSKLLRKPRKKITRLFVIVLAISIFGFLGYQVVFQNIFNINVLGDRTFGPEMTSEFVDVFPMKVEGDWNGVPNSRGIPDVEGDSDARFFSDSNSAVYEGGLRSLIFSEFGATWDDLENMTENEDVEDNEDVEASENIEEPVEEEINNGVEIQGDGSEEQEIEKQDDSLSWGGLIGKKIAQAAQVFNFDEIKKNKFIGARIVLSFAARRDYSVEHSQEDNEDFIDQSLDTAIIVRYSVDGESWLETDFFTEKISNKTNEGYFNYNADLVEDWDDLENLQVEFEGMAEDGTAISGFLDSVWVEVEYGTSESKKDDEDEDEEEDLQLMTDKKGWRKDEHPKFKIEDPEMHDSFLERTRDKVAAVFEEDADVVVKLKAASGAEFDLEKNKDYKIKDEGSIEVELLPQDDLPPGDYTVDVLMEKDGVQQSFEGKFTWGLLAVNVNKSIYLENEEAHVQLAALNSSGHTICDANLRVEIVEPDLSNKILRTKDGTIEKSETCGADNVTDIADYFFYYETDDVGTYDITVTNLDEDFEISDSFEVEKRLEFEVERLGATRINPFKAAYEMTFNIDANKDFEGSITETVPKSFEIELSEDFSVSEGDDEKYITWENVEINKGEGVTFSYVYQAPEESPLLHLLGPLRLEQAKKGIGSWLVLSDKPAFKEARHWQIAADAVGDVDIGRWTDTTTTLNPTTAWAAPNGLFTTQARNDNSTYTFTDSTASVDIGTVDADGYLMVASFEHEATHNERFNPQGRIVQTSGTGTFVSAYTSGYSRDTSEDRAFVRTWAFVDGPSAGADFQFQWKRDSDTPTGGTVTSSFDIIPLYYGDVGVYSSTSAALYGGTTPNVVTGFTGTDGTNVTITSDVVTVTGDNKRYLVLGSWFLEGFATRTQRIGGFDIDGTQLLSAQGYAYSREAGDDEVGAMMTHLMETATASKTIEMTLYRGDGVLANQGGADVDGSTPSVGQHALVVVELNDSAEVFQSTDGTGNVDLNVTGPVDISATRAVDINFNDSASFTRSTDTAMDATVGMDALMGANLWAAQEVITTTARWTSRAHFTVNGTEDVNTKHGNYARNDQGTIDTFGWSANLLSFVALAQNDDVGVSIQEITGGEDGGQYEINADTAGFWGINLDTLSDASVPSTRQLHFRWRDDTTDLNTSGGWLAIEDNNTIGEVAKSDTYRLRVESANVGAAVDSAARTYELQWGDKTGASCSAISTWTGLANSSDEFDMVATTHIDPDGEATTAGLLANTETYTRVNGEGRESADTTGSIGPLSASNFTELEYSFQATDDAVTGHTYCFRLYDTTAGSTLDAYSVYPEMTISYTDVAVTKTVMEWDTEASVGDDAWTTVSFTGTYDDPIFVCSAEYNANIGNESDATADSMVCRVQNVGSTSAQVRLQEPGTLVGATGNLTDETIHWMVVEAGEYDNADIKMEAFKYTSTVTDGKSPVNWTGQQQTLGQSYTSPVVVGQVMTTNDTGHSAFWAHNGSNLAPTSALIYTGKHISEDTDTTRSNETIGVIVIEQANDSVNSIVYESRLQTQIIDRIDDSPPTTYTFNTSFSTTPSVAIISLAGVSGTDGPYPSLYGTSILSTTTIDLVVMETEIVDTEQSGNPEFVPYVVFESAGTYSVTTNVPLDQDTYRFYQNADAIQPSTSLGNENTAITGVAGATVLRIRTAVQAGETLEAEAIATKLQYGEGATCSAIGTWYDVGGLGSVTIWRGYDNATPADGASITASLLNATSNALESYEEANNSADNPTQITDGSRGEWDWVVQNNGATASTDYCFRATKSDGSVMEYTRYPKVTTDVAGNISVSGTVYLANETTQATTGNGGQCDSSTSNLSLRVNGGTEYTTTCSSTDGSFTFSSVPANASNTITIYSTDSTDKSNRVYVSDGTADTGMDLYKDTVALGDEQDGSLNILDTTDYDNDQNATDLLFDAEDTITDTFDVESGIEMHIHTGDTFAPSGDVTTVGSTGHLHLDDSATLTQGSTDHTIGGDVLIDSSATLSATDSGAFYVGGSWTNAGTFTHNSGTVTFNATTTGHTISDGDSAFNNLVFNGSGGEWLYTDGTSTAPNQTTVQNGTPTFLNVKTGTVSVTGGTLNVDWYLGTHVVDADNTSTDIDTDDNDVTLSESSDNSTVWEHNGSVWGSGAALQTTGTSASGDNPQPNSSGAIRIREFSMTASASCPGAGCTLYKYNEEVAWSGSYGEYDYHDDQGENYLTSCLAGSTSSCSDDTADDDVIGVGWYRSTIGTMNAPLSTVNNPSTNGSWHVGMLEALSFSLDSFSKNYGILQPGSNPTDQTNTLTATSSASHGYVIYARAIQDMTCSNSLVCGTAAISDWSGTNTTPTTWSGGSFGFGYSTNDYDLQGGTADRFSGPDFAGFVETGFGDPVADRTGPSSGQENVITYRIAPQAVQDAGPYQTSIVYIIVATY